MINTARDLEQIQTLMPAHDLLRTAPQSGTNAHGSRFGQLCFPFSTLVIMVQVFVLC